MAQKRDICFNCGRIVSIKTTTSGENSSDRTVSAEYCGCSKGELKQRTRPSEQLDKYKHGK